MTARACQGRSQTNSIAMTRHCGTTIMMQAIAEAGGIPEPALPPHMQDLFTLPERYEVIEHDLAAVQDYIRRSIAC